MAARSIFLALTRNCCGRSLSRSLSSSCASRSEVIVKESHTSQDEETQDFNGEHDDLKSGISRLYLPRFGTSNILQKWVSEGRKLTSSDLFRRFRDRLRSRPPFHYRHAFEISEWMVSHEEFELSDYDCAIHIFLMVEVVGYDATGQYLLGLPDTGKTTETYKALVLIYYWARRLKFYDEIYEGYEEKFPKAVDKAIQKIKRRNGALNLFTYNLWICSYVATQNIDGVRMVLDEMTNDSGSNKCKVRYANLANICITSGNFMNADSSNSVEYVIADVPTISLDWVTYDLPIVFYTGLGDKHKVDKIWNLSMSSQKIKSRNYGCILSSYLMLGYLREASEVIDQWKQAFATEFVISNCSRLLKAFSDVGLMETAETFRTLLTEMGFDIISMSQSEGRCVVRVFRQR